MAEKTERKLEGNEKTESQSRKLRKLIFQGNPLIQARKEFNALEGRIFMLGLRGINPRFSNNDKFYDNQFPILFIPTARLIELFGGNTAYLHDLDKVCDKLFDAKIHLRYEDGGFCLMHVFRRLEYIPKEGLYLQFDEYMRQYLLDLLETKGYTQLDVEQLFQLSSAYSVRLVELLLQYQNVEEFKAARKITREMTIDDLRFALNVPEGAYEGRLGNLFQKVLDSPIAEINEKTLYHVSYETIKQNGRVVGVKLQMDVSVVPLADSLFTRFDASIRKLREVGFTLESAQDILARCRSNDDCLSRLETAKQLLERQKKRNRKPVENELGFLRQAIIENWKPAKKPKTLPRLTATKPKVLRSKPKTAREVIAENQAKKAEILPLEQIGCSKKPIPESQREMIFEWLDSPSTKTYVDRMLRTVGWTLKEFLEKYPR